MKTCPACAEEKGTSIRLVDITTDPRLILHCDSCQHEWPFPGPSRERGAGHRSPENRPQHR